MPSLKKHAQIIAALDRHFDIAIQTTVKLTAEQISDLLTVAFEGGVNYWCEIRKLILPPGMTKQDFAWAYSELPLHEGGAMILGTNENDPNLENKRLDRFTIKRGLSIMAEDHPRHWQDLVNENYDADTADVFLQCCLFGELVFG